MVCACNDIGIDVAISCLGAASREVVAERWAALVTGKSRKLRKDQEASLCNECGVASREVT